MDSITKRSVGRPKAPSRTGPLVLESDPSRETVEVQLSSEVARELAEYAAWVELSSSLTTADATFTTVEYALREVFRRDRVWRERRRSRERPTEVGSNVALEPSVKSRSSSSPPSAQPGSRGGVASSI